MNLRIIKAGVLDTVQDLGRFGWQQLGINPGGAMDRFAAQAANLLVGNNRDEALIELHFPAAEIFFEEPALIAITGADFSPHVNAEEIPTGHPVLINKYSILQFYGVQSGARAYLAVLGGLNLPRWLNSFSTHLKVNAGGYHGRALQKDDEIGICPVPAPYISLLGKSEFVVLPWKAGQAPPDENESAFFLLEGPEWERLTATAKQQLITGTFTITPQSDRMGYRLKGMPLQVSEAGEMVSAAVSFGTVQLLPDGQLIVLMADHQTTGGYPRIAQVISAHHALLAQKRAGDQIRFRFTNLAVAEELWMKQQQHLRQLQNACTFRFQELIHATRH